MGKINSLNIKNNIEVGERFFNLGVFFLSTALAISGVFFLISIILSALKSNTFLKDRYNYFLYLSSGIMLFKNINIAFSQDPIFQSIKSDAWVDLINWIPFFILYIYFQNYVKTINQRRLIAKILILSLVPVLFSCILQHWFNLYGPFQTLNGLIVWFQKPITLNHGGVTGLFSNQNYTGLWITSTIPFLIAEYKLSNKNKIFTGILIFLSIYFTFLTTSKNAILGLFLIFIFLFEWRKKNLLKISLIFGSLIALLNVINKIILYFSDLNTTSIPKIAIEKFLNFNFFDSNRYEGYKNTIFLISQRPFSGWSKPLFYEKFKIFGNEFNLSHTHSMPLEIAFNYGIPLALLLIIFVLLLLFQSAKYNKKFSLSKEVYFHNKAWITSTLIIVVSHITDITYYDGKISILIWILLSGLRSITLAAKNL